MDPPITNIQYQINLISDIGGIFNAKLEDIDKIVISYLDPLHILNLSEVNTYYSKLTWSYRISMSEIKYNLELAVMKKSRLMINWILQKTEQSISMLCKIYPKIEHDYTYAKILNLMIKYNCIELLDYVIRHNYLIYMGLGDFIDLYNNHFDVDFYDKIVAHLDDDFLQEAYGEYHCRISKLMASSEPANDNNYIGAFHSATHHFTKMSMIHCKKKFVSTLAKILKSCVQCHTRPDTYQIIMILELVDTYNISIDMDIHDCFKIICKYGNKDQIEKILNYGLKRNISFADDLNEMLVHIISLKKIKNLIDLDAKYYQKIDIHRNKEHAFRRACLYGDKDTAECLIGLGEQTHGKIDIHVENEECFRNAVMARNLKIVKWLIELGENRYGKIDIHIMDNNIIDISIKNMNSCKFKPYLQLTVKIMTYILSLSYKGYGNFPEDKIALWNDAVKKYEEKIEKK